MRDLTRMSSGVVGSYTAQVDHAADHLSTTIRVDHLILTVMRRCRSANAWFISWPKSLSEMRAATCSPLARCCTSCSLEPALFLAPPS